MEPLRERDGKFRATQKSLDRAQQIAVSDETKIALFDESESVSLTN
jgi:hypothetical protein